MEADHQFIVGLIQENFPQITVEEINYLLQRLETESYQIRKVNLQEDNLSLEQEQINFSRFKNLVTKSLSIVEEHINRWDEEPKSKVNVALKILEIAYAGSN